MNMARIIIPSSYSEAPKMYIQHNVSHNLMNLPFFKKNLNNVVSHAILDIPQRQSSIPLKPRLWTVSEYN